MVCPFNVVYLSKCVIIGVLKYALLTPLATAPERATPGAAGLDLASAYTYSILPNGLLYIVVCFQYHKTFQLAVYAKQICK